MALKRITAPDDTPVTLEEAKRHLRVEDDSSDESIQFYLNAVTAYLEGKEGTLQKALKEQVWELTLDAFPTVALELPLPPLIGIVSVKYDDEDGNEQTIGPANYVADTDSVPGRLIFIDDVFTAPTLFDAGVNPIRIRLTVGYPDEWPESGESGGPVSTVPDTIKAAILLMVGDLFSNREGASPDDIKEIAMETTIKNLLRAHKPFIIA